MQEPQVLAGVQGQSPWSSKGKPMSGSSPRLSPALNVVVSAVRKAGRRLLRDFGEVEQLQVSMKGPGDFVSQADLRAEQTLREDLSKARPGF
eukprot:gene4752-5949_t